MNEDMFNRCLLRTDPKIAMSATEIKKKPTELTTDMKMMLVLPKNLCLSVDEVNDLEGYTSESDLEGVEDSKDSDSESNLSSEEESDEDSETSEILDDEDEANEENKSSESDEENY